MEGGYIHAYYGNGKGKTTAALGLALRCAGRGFKVGYTAFLKSFDSGEFIAELPFHVFKNGGVTGFWKDFSDDKRRNVAIISKELLDEVFFHAAKENYDMIVLDEALNAVEAGALSEEYLLKLLNNRPKGLEVVLTGRNITDAILDISHYVTEMKQIKHPYHSGTEARIGIEM